MSKVRKYFFNSSDWSIIIVYFVMALVIAFSNFNNISWGFFIYDFLSYVVYSIIPIYIIMRYVLPSTFEKGKYLLFFVYGFITLGVMGYIEMWTYRIIESKDWNMWNFEIVFIGIVSQAENIGLLLALLIGKRFYETKLEYSDLEKEKKSSELRMLNSQIDPHFLFNNLNTVDNLIDSDPESAKKYLNQLSKLYRYLISTKDEELVLLRDEIDFVENYVYLIEKRFGNAFLFDIKIDTELLDDTFVPPGAIQGLVENAVKHNMGTPTRPILINVFSTDDQLLVTNNLNKRDRAIDSTGMGLENTNERYKLIYGQPIEIVETDTFTVKLPIIHNSEDQ